MSLKLIFAILAALPDIIQILKQLDDRHYDLDSEEKKLAIKNELKKVSDAIREENAEALRQSFRGDP